MFDVLKAPLRIATVSGLVLGTAKTLNGFKTNCSTALEIKSTRALANDVGLLEEYGPLEIVNSGEEVKLRLPCFGEEAFELNPDGLIVSTTSSVLLFNSAKHTPSVDDIDQLLLDVQKLGRILSSFASVTTTPPAAKEQLNRLPFSSATPLRIVPFLSGENFSAFVAAECEKMGVGVVRPSGEGFVVKVGSGRRYGATI
jgi:hypothetical protein